MIPGLIIVALIGTGGAPMSGEDCLRCHPDLAKTLAGPRAHRPAAEKRCMACHDPHAAREPKLLKQPESQLCLSCHEKSAAELQRPTVHSPAARGCVRCHPPHAKTVPQGSEVAALCGECHPPEKLLAKKIKHAPAAEGSCSACHVPHGSTGRGLLRANGEVCGKCHAPAELRASHRSQPVAAGRCTNCHDPHASDEPHLLRPGSHKPFARGQCDKCHGRSDRNDPRLCLSCHKRVKEDLRATGSHLSGDDGNCLLCHDPHASPEKKLVRAGIEEVCFSCHRGTKAKLDQRAVRHSAIERCQDCHRVHGSDHLVLLPEGESGTCTACHERHATFTHPLGEKAIDVRNQRGMTCTSCHGVMGTQHQYHLFEQKDRDLCLLCH